MVVLTGANRDKVEIEWSNKSWTHNVFRAYEFIFWRRSGIRVESSVVPFFDKEGALLYEEIRCHTFEAVCANIETMVRERIPRLKIVKVAIPVLAFNNNFKSLGTPYLFAIALDATATGVTDNTSNPSSWSHTCTGSSRGLILIVSQREVYSTTSAAYAGSGATYVIGSRTTNNTGDLPQIFKKIAPSTGANNATYTGGTGGTTEQKSGMSISFTGVDQTTLTGAANKYSATTASASYSLTLTGTNSYTVESQWGQNSGGLTQAQGQTEIADRSLNTRQHAGAYKAQGASGSVTLGYTSVNQVNDAAFAEVLIGAVTTTIVCAQGAYSLTGQALLIYRTIKIALAQGAYTLTGQALLLGKRFTLIVSQGAYVLTGQALIMLRSIKILAAQGAYALTGQNLILSRMYTLVISSGSYALTGISLFLRAFYTALTKNTATHTAETKNVVTHTHLAENEATYTGLPRSK